MYIYTFLHILYVYRGVFEPEGWVEYLLLVLHTEFCTPSFCRQKGICVDSQGHLLYTCMYIKRNEVGNTIHTHIYTCVYTRVICVLKIQIKNIYINIYIYISAALTKFGNRYFGECSTY